MDTCPSKAACSANFYGTSTEANCFGHTGMCIRRRIQKGKTKEQEDAMPSELVNIRNGKWHLVDTLTIEAELQLLSICNCSTDKRQCGILSRPVHSLFRRGF